jgi:hypothetical protein
MQNISKKLTGVVVLVIVLIAGGLFWYASIKEKQAQVEQEQVQASQRNQQQIKNDVQTTESVDATIATGIDMDVNHWQVYHNEQYGYEFKYPKTWTLKEVNELNIEGRNSFYERYVSIQSPDDTVYIEIGMKNANEDNVLNRVWRTGIPEGDFHRADAITLVANNPAEKRYLIYKTKDESLIQLVWLCKPGGDLTLNCDNFSLGEGKEGFIGMDGKWMTDTNQWHVAEKVLDMVVASISLKN